MRSTYCPGVLAKPISEYSWIVSTPGTKFYCILVFTRLPECTFMDHYSRICIFLLNCNQ